MRMCVVGTGYVGLVAGTCFSDVGNHVICVDKDASKIGALLDGQVPIYEPGLGEMIRHNVKAGRLEFTTDLARGVADSLLVFLAVGTPQTADGSADLTGLFAAVAEIGRAMNGYRIIITKSTVPIGTHERVAQAIRDVTDQPFDYVSNPEFLKEGAAIDDFTKPDRVVIGTTNPAVVEIMKQAYGPFMRKRERLLVMDPASAEMTKYAANALLASRISFMNEVANLCEKYGADVDRVRTGVGYDSRIGHAFLFPGVGYGGSCFPKDVRALIAMGRETGAPMSICEASDAANLRQRHVFARRVLDYYENRDRRACLAVWGLAFKGRTDDVREAPAMDAIRAFVDGGMTIRAHDPEAIPNARQLLGENGISYHDDAYGALEEADGLVIFTDWQEYRTPDFELMAEKMSERVIFDGRNLYDPRFAAKHGFEYHCVGRPTHRP